jgi:hypothetical protein
MNYIPIGRACQTESNAIGFANGTSGRTNSSEKHVMGDPFLGFYISENGISFIDCNFTGSIR